MAREYTIQAGNLTVLGNNTMAFINPASPGFTLEILRVIVSQSGTAVSQQQRIQFHTQASTFPTLVSATPSKTKIGDPVSQITGATTGAAGTCGVNASAEGAGAQTSVYQDNFNNLNGFLWVATPPETFMVNATTAAGFGVKLLSTPTTLTGWSVTVVYRELG
jgi:hypothetical protein